jgi:hypothetical protein
MMLLGLVLLLWVAVATVFIAACVCAGRADRLVRGGGQTLPLRSTWRTVRSSTLRSPHSDQLAT